MSKKSVRIVLRVERGERYRVEKVINTLTPRVGVVLSKNDAQALVDDKNIEVEIRDMNR